MCKLLKTNIQNLSNKFNLFFYTFTIDFKDKSDKTRSVIR